MRGFFNSLAGGSAENSFTLFIHDLPSLIQRNAGGIFDAGATVGTNEAIFLHFAIDRLGNDAADLILPALAIGRGNDQKVLVFKATSLFRLCRCLGGRASTEKRRFKKTYRLPFPYVFVQLSYPGTNAAYVNGSDASACAAPWLRSDGYVRG